MVFISNNECLRDYHYFQPLHLKYQSLLLPAMFLYPPLPPLHPLLPSPRLLPGTDPPRHAPEMVKQNKKLHYPLAHQTQHPLHPLHPMLLLKMSGGNAGEHN